MDSNTFLNRYQLSVGENGAAIALHRGPSGVTYRAEDIETDQPVAVKLMPTYSFELPELQQLEAEARAAQKVDHPNIARLYNFGFNGNDVVFVTELLDGTTLDAWVGEHGPLPAAAVLRIALQVVSGLAAASFHSVVHRAIQPANLMIVPGQTPEGEWPFVKVLNFGGVPPTLSNSAVSFGQGGPSPQFAAPERLEGKPADFRSELYSLGCTMWFLLTGVMPTPGAVDKGGVVPKAVRPLLAQLVALNPMQRPQDPVLLQEQLNECLAVVERRAGIARKFGVAPAAPAPVAVVAAAPVVASDLEVSEIAPAAVPPSKALLKPLALAAAVLLLAGIAALALPTVLRWRQAAGEPIGVPVGVPDGSSAAAVATNSTATPVAQQATGVQTNVASAPANTPTVAPVSTVAAAMATASPEVAANTPSPTEDTDQALVSVLPPSPTDADNSETPAPAATATPAVVATNTDGAASVSNVQAAPADAPDSGGGLPAGERNPNSVVAQNPSDAGEQVTRNSSARASETPEPTATPARVAERTEQKPATTPARVVKTAPKRPSRIARNEVRPAEPVEDADLVNAPPVPRGSKRARYLGTSPEGDLIFGLPSDQRGYVAPPRGYVPDARRARRARPVIVEPPPADEVRPAEPVEPGDG